MSSLASVTKGRTTIMIAHRLSTIQHADGEACYFIVAPLDVNYQPHSFFTPAGAGSSSSHSCRKHFCTRVHLSLWAEIVVMHQGAVEERGTHEALLRAGGRYAAMWHRQSHHGSGPPPAAPSAPSA